VRGHGPGQETLQVGKRDVDITRVEQVGAYAVKPVFSDGHDSGIYSWDYLYLLAENQRRCGPTTWRGLRPPAPAAIQPTRHAAPPAGRLRHPLRARIPNDSTDFGFETVAEAAKAQRVASVFSSVARRYDIMNDLMSAGLHRTVEEIRHRDGRPRPGNACSTWPPAPATSRSALCQARPGEPVARCGIPTSIRTCCVKGGTA
jgi:hypothetical protein